MFGRIACGLSGLGALLFRKRLCPYSEAYAHVYCGTPLLSGTASAGTTTARVC